MLIIPKLKKILRKVKNSIVERYIGILSINRANDPALLFFILSFVSQKQKCKSFTCMFMEYLVVFEKPINKFLLFCFSFCFPGVNISINTSILSSFFHFSVNSRSTRCFSLGLKAHSSIFYATFLTCILYANSISLISIAFYNLIFWY